MRRVRPGRRAASPAARHRTRRLGLASSCRCRRGAVLGGAGVGAATRSGAGAHSQRRTLRRAVPVRRHRTVRQRHWTELLQRRSSHRRWRRKSMRTQARPAIPGSYRVGGLCPARGTRRMATPTQAMALTERLRESGLHIEVWSLTMRRPAAPRRRTTAMSVPALRCAAVWSRRPLREAALLGPAHRRRDPQRPSAQATPGAPPKSRGGRCGASRPYG